MRGIDPCVIVGEILGQPSRDVGDLAKSSYQCPFMCSTCKKSSQKMVGPYPVCSIFKSGSGTVQDLIAVCPKRFLNTTFVSDIVKHCWSGIAPKNLQVAYEVKMGDVGTVDAVVADIDTSRNSVCQFVSVELQAVDITGSYFPAYSALLSNTSLENKPNYGFNWANVRKRYITQLVSKGFYHQQWGTRIASVVQDHIFNYFQSRLKFDELAPSKADIVFFVYKYQESRVGQTISYDFVLDKVVGTSHSSLMMRALYSETPPKSEFCDRIIQKVTSQWSEHGD